jgi:hypothetical protein
MLDYSKMHVRKKAIFNPKTPNIRPYLAKHFGRAFTFQCSDYGHEGDPYPGQYRWFALADDETPAGRARGKLHPDFHHWVPDEDLIDIP